MSRGDRLALIAPIVILIIVAAFVYLATLLLGTLGSRAILLNASSEKLRSEPLPLAAWHQASEMSCWGDSAHPVWKHLAWILGSIVTLFFFVLGAFGLILVVVMLSEFIHRYVQIPEKRETELLTRRRQILTHRKRFHRGKYSYTPRQPKVQQQRPDNNANNGC